MIDLRSDTVAKPTPEMLQAMMQAEVGDDVFEEDPTVIQLEEKAAVLLGMECGLFCPSGTMTNQIALRILTQPQDEVICDKRSHIYNYEGGGIAYNSLISVRLLDGDRGILSPDQIVENINIDDIHFPQTSLVSLENTVNKGGGSYYYLQQIADITKICREHQLKIHLDGARLFNALVETEDRTSDYGQYFDTISICLSKGLGAPIGSLLLSSAELIKRAKRVRKVFGGGMRQSGYLAAAGIYALDHHIDRLKDDHRRSRDLGKILERLPYVSSVLPVDTNIVIFDLSSSITSLEFLGKLQQAGIKAVPFGKHTVRFVTHLEFDDHQLEQSEDILKKLVL